MDEPPPTNCTICDEPNCNDWMYRCGLVPKEQAICGKCKRKIEEKINENLKGIIIKK